MVPDRRLQRIIQETLSGAVTGLVMCSSLREALDHHSITDSEVAVIDSDHGGRKTKEIIEVFLHANPNLQLILLSSYVDDEYATMIRELGGWSVLSKEDLLQLSDVISEIPLGPAGKT